MGGGGKFSHTLQPPWAADAWQTLQAAPGERPEALPLLPLGPPTLGAARRLQIKGCPGHRANLAEVAAPSHFAVCLGNSRKDFAKLER